MPRVARKRAAVPAGLGGGIPAAWTDEETERPASLGGQLQTAALEQVERLIAFQHDGPERSRAQPFLRRPQTVERCIGLRENHQSRIEQAAKPVRTEERKMPARDPEARTRPPPRNPGGEDARGRVAWRSRDYLVHPSAP